MDQRTPEKKKAPLVLLIVVILALLIAVNLAGSVGESRQRKKDKLQMGGRS